MLSWVLLMPLRDLRRWQYLDDMRRGFVTEIQWGQVAGRSALMTPADKEHGPEREPWVHLGHHTNMAIIQANGCPNRIERKLVNHRLEKARLKGLFVLN
jgi:hypothetical protein